VDRELELRGGFVGLLCLVLVVLAILVAGFLGALLALG